MDVSNYFENRNPLKNMVVNGMFFYVAQPDVFGSSLAVGAVELPGPGVAEVTQDVDRDSLMILKPGVHIAIDLEDITEPGKVNGWLEDKLEKNGWVLDPDAELVLQAKMGVGEMQSVQYREIGRGVNSETKTLRFRPHYASLKIIKGKTSIWQSGTSTSPPAMIRGSNAQSQMDRFQYPRLRFFEDIVIEKKIIDPKFSRGFGVSSLGLNGIQVVSTSPPGREDDPNSSAAQAEEDQKKAREDRRSEQENGGQSGSGGGGGAFGGFGNGRDR